MIGTPAVIDRGAGRRGAARGGPADDGPLWETLVRGGFTVVCGGAGGLALRPVPDWERRALSEREAAVLRACCLGQSNKVVAHGLGIGAGGVSTALAGAARKLGAPSGRVLVQLVSALVPVEVPAGLDDLTAAELEVATLVGRGLSNVEIACARGCSPSTVANQIASIFRKTGLGSRRAVMVALRLGAGSGLPEGAQRE
jgi:DNA-binding CsgD family transcriptional regulator